MAKKKTPDAEDAPSHGGGGRPNGGGRKTPHPSLTMAVWPAAGAAGLGAEGGSKKKAHLGKGRRRGVIRDFGNLASGNGEIRSLFSFRLPCCSNRRRCSFHEWLFAFGKEERNLLL